MRYGYTTGSCAAAASKAALIYLLTGIAPRTVRLQTPKGKILNLIVEKSVMDAGTGDLTGGERQSSGFSHLSRLRAQCAIRKDAGDDPDVTHGTLICSEVILTLKDPEAAKRVFKESKCVPETTKCAHEESNRVLEEIKSVLEETTGWKEYGTPCETTASVDYEREILEARTEENPGVQAGSWRIMIDGGEGIGRVTKAGLDQPVGAAAINSGPRAMIEQAIFEVLAQFSDLYGEADASCREERNTVRLKLGRSVLLNAEPVIQVVISAPEGALLGKRTFNPMMGIEGGISILGTTGIVEPMSDSAIAGTIEAEISVIAAAGHKNLMINLGNYGENFTKNFLGLGTNPSVKCANFIGVAVNAAVAEGMDRILLIGHIGKLVKLGISMFNTHSNNGDGRLETLAACAIESGVSADTARRILESATTEAAIEILEADGILAAVLDRLKNRIAGHIARHVPDSVRMEFICFSGKIGQWRLLFQSEGASRMQELWREKSS